MKIKFAGNVITWNFKTRVICRVFVNEAPSILAWNTDIQLWINESIPHFIGKQVKRDIKTINL